MNNIIYKIKVATKNQIESHLKSCDENFTTLLIESVDIEKYAQKIFESSITFEAWIDNKIVGLMAVYFNNVINQCAFITNISVIKEFMRVGIASALLRMCIDYATQNNFYTIRLEVNEQNIKAFSLYEKFGFVKYNLNNHSVQMQLEIV